MGEIYYIGGSPCSGKSTIAEMLAAEYDFAYYRVDEFLYSHMEAAAAAGKPHSALNLSFNFEQMWMRDPQLQYDEEIAIYAEILPYALRDISAMDTKKPIIAEGAGFMPELMAAENVGSSHYICIAPTEEFQREKYAQRPWIGEFLKGCTDPKAAFDNWMSRDVLFAKHVLETAQKTGYAAILVDGEQSVEENFKIAAEVFRLI